MESSPAGTKILQLRADDKDNDAEQKITYRITSGNPEGFFALNGTTGENNETKLFHSVVLIQSLFLFFFLFFCTLYFYHVNVGLITTTSRKLDRENQPEHILEVK